MILLLANISSAKVGEDSMSFILSKIFTCSVKGSAIED